LRPTFTYFQGRNINSKNGHTCSSVILCVGKGKIRRDNIIFEGSVVAIGFIIDTISKFVSKTNFGKIGKVFMKFIVRPQPTIIGTFQKLVFQTNMLRQVE
jgi:hypothetical protein